MKKLLLTIVIVLSLKNALWSQCVATCSAYVLTPITFSTFPNTGTNLIPQFAPNADDGITGAVPIGFNFNFYCGTYSQVIVCSNGFISFDFVNAINPATSQTSQYLPNTTNPNGIVCYNWNDLDASVGGTVTYTTIGTAPNRMFVLTYSNVPIWATSLLNSGQIVLFETSNNIEIHSGLISTSPYLGTQGIENLAGTLATTVPNWNNATWNTSNTAYRWQQAVVGTPPTAPGGNTLVCAGDVNNYTVSTMPGANSYNWSLPPGWLLNGNGSAITATAGTSGLMSITATYTCGVSAPTTYSVNVKPSPNIVVGSTTPFAVCTGSQVQVNVTGGTTYTLDPGATPVTSPFTFTVASSSTVYSLTATGSNGCSTPAGAGVVIALTVYDSPTVSVNSGTVCLGQSFTMSPTGANSYSYTSLFSAVTPSAAGSFTYGVVGTSSNSCFGVATSSLTVNGLPSVTAAASRTAMCPKETVSLTVQGASSYSWAVLNSSSSNVTVSPSGTTIYTVSGSNSQGCSSSATVMVQLNFCTGINETSAAGGLLEVYPNPSAGIFKIKAGTGTTIVLSDLTGKELLHQTLEAGEHSIDLTRQPSGVYLLKAVSGTVCENIRIVRE